MLITALLIALTILGISTLLLILGIRVRIDRLESSVSSAAKVSGMSLSFDDLSPQLKQQMRSVAEKRSDADALIVIKEAMSIDESKAQLILSQLKMEMAP